MSEVVDDFLGELPVDENTSSGDVEAADVVAESSSVRELPGGEARDVGRAPESDDVVPLSHPIPERWAHLEGRVRLPERLNDVLFFTLLTVPDVDRFPVPKEFSAEKIPVDFEAMEVNQMTAGEVKGLVKPSVPDDQLSYLLNLERDRAAKGKSRNVSIKAIEKEIDRRGNRWPKWVADHAFDPLKSRIAAIAWATGEGDETVAVALRTDSVAEAACIKSFNDIVSELIGVDVFVCRSWPGVQSAELWPFLVVRAIVLGDEVDLVNYADDERWCAGERFERRNLILEALRLQGDGCRFADPCAVFEAWRNSDVSELKRLVLEQLEATRRVQLCGV